MIRLVQFGDLPDPYLNRLRKRPPRAKASRQLLYDTVKYASDVNADIILCTGDLFDTNAPYYVTLRSAADAFSRVKIPVLISPGNHDPYRKDSPYSSSWSENVHVFKEPHPREIVLEKLGVRITGIVNTEQNQASRPLIDYTVKRRAHKHTHNARRLCFRRVKIFKHPAGGYFKIRV